MARTAARRCLHCCCCCCPARLRLAPPPRCHPARSLLQAPSCQTRPAGPDAAAAGCRRLRCRGCCFAESRCHRCGSTQRPPIGCCLPAATAAAAGQPRPCVPCPPAAQTAARMRWPQAGAQWGRRWRGRWLHLPQAHIACWRPAGRWAQPPLRCQGMLLLWHPQGCRWGRLAGTPSLTRCEAMPAPARPFHCRPTAAAGPPAGWPN